MTPTRETRDNAPTLDEITYDDEDSTDIHAASTMVAELPNELLESLKSPALRSTATTAPPPCIRPSDSPVVEVSPDLVIVDLATLLESDEPETLQLETILLGATLPPAPRPPTEFQVHLADPAAGTLDLVQSEIAQLPRSWKIAGTCLAVVVLTGVFVALLSVVAN